MNFTPALVTEERPLELKEELPATTLKLEEDPAVRAEKPLQVELVVTRDGEDFQVTGWLSTSLLLQCGRCTEWFPFPVRVQMDHHFEAPHPNSIDLTPFIREDILLELPLNAACRLGADGRCPVTGEVYRPRPEDTGSLIDGTVWAELSKIIPKDR